MNNSADESIAHDRLNNKKTTVCEYFECTIKVIRGTPANSSRLNIKVVVPLKYLSKFWRFI